MRVRTQNKAHQNSFAQAALNHLQIKVGVQEDLSGSHAIDRAKSKLKRAQKFLRR